MKILQWRDELWDCMTSIIGPISATTIDGQGHHQGCVVRSVPYSKPQGQAFRGKQIQHQQHNFATSISVTGMIVAKDLESKKYPVHVNIARIANAVQVTICLLVSTSVY